MFTGLTHTIGHRPSTDQQTGSRKGKQQQQGQGQGRRHQFPLRFPHSQSGESGTHSSGSNGSSSNHSGSLPLVLGRRSDQPPSARTGQYHRQQEVKMQRIRSLLLASLSINCLCGFLLATMTGYVTVVLAWGFFTRDVKDAMPAALIPTKVQEKEGGCLPARLPACLSICLPACLPARLLFLLGACVHVS